MLEKFIFENHLGQRFDGLANGVYLNQNDLRDYQWDYDTINGRISRFYRKIKKRKLPLVFVGKTDEQAAAVKHQLLDMAEADIEALLPGKIFIGDYYTKGYITESKKSKYLISRRYCNNELTFISEDDDSMWYREETKSFRPGSGTQEANGTGRDYPYEYSFDYVASQAAALIMCDSVRESAFRIKIYGYVTNPAVTINGHAYAVNGTVEAGENLIIDSTTKTITLNTAMGNKVNWFDRRNRESYIFQPIPAGINTVSCNSSFGFDLTVIEKRSEPKWT
jgi:hypothetical protein